MKPLLLIFLFALAAYSQKYSNDQTMSNIDTPFSQSQSASTYGNYGNGNHNRNNENYKGKHELSERQIE